jgi:hypothetical protein
MMMMMMLTITLEMMGKYKLLAREGKENPIIIRMMRVGRRMVLGEDGIMWRMCRRISQ